MRRFTPLIVIVILLATIKPAKSFLEFEKFLIPFKKKHVQTVRIVNQEAAPVKILSAKVADKGSARNKSMTGIFNDFTVTVHNVSNKDVMSYRVAWTLKLPFESWVEQRTEVNSIDVLKAGQTQTMHFKIDKYFRDDAFYYVSIMKAQFSDDTIWEAPEDDQIVMQMDKVKDEINSIDEKSIDDMTLDEIKKHMQENTTNGAASSPVTH